MTKAEVLAMYAPPSRKDLVASMRNWLDAEFDPPLEKAIDEVERLYRGRYELASPEWIDVLDGWYRKFLFEYKNEEHPVIPFVEATDAELQDMVENILWRYDHLYEAVRGKYGTPTAEHLQELRRQANEQATRINCTERVSGKMLDNSISEVLLMMNCER